MKVGLTLGKFSPLHRGHQWMIEQALAQVDRLYVLIYESPEIQGVPRLDVRAGWLRTLYPQVRVIEGWGAPSTQGDTPEIMREQEDYIMSMLPEKVTHFFSSEWYGAHVSAALQAEDVRVDMARAQVPVSATSIRDNAYLHREYVHPGVYRDLITKVVLLGAESTGKTTLAEHLAQQYQTVWMPEHGREYWEQHHDEEGKLSATQLVELAREHLAREQELLLEADRYLFVDTNALTTARFCAHYHGEVPDELGQLAEHAARRYECVIVCDDNIPYVEDGTRSGEAHRRRFQKGILEDLTSRGIPFHLVRGTLEERCTQVAQILKLPPHGAPDTCNVTTDRKTEIILL